MIEKPPRRRFLINNQQSSINNQAASDGCSNLKPARPCPPVQKASYFAPCASAPGRVPLTCSHWPRSRVGLPRPRPFPAARRTPITDTDTQNLEGSSPVRVCITRERSGNCVILQLGDCVIETPCGTQLPNCKKLHNSPTALS